MDKAWERSQEVLRGLGFAGLVRKSRVGAERGTGVAPRRPNSLKIRAATQEACVSFKGLKLWARNTEPVRPRHCMNERRLTR